MLCLFLESMEKEIKLLMPTDWFLRKPVDVEYNEYIIMSFIKKVEDALSRGEIYPYFSELALHLAVCRAYIEDGLLLGLDKTFTTPDDEIMLFEIKNVKSRKKFTDKEYKDIRVSVVTALEKLKEYFVVAKSVWEIGYQSVATNPIKNGEHAYFGAGFFIYQDIFNKENYIWKYSIKKIRQDTEETKCDVERIYKGEQSDRYSKLIDQISDSKFPIFECISSQNLPIENSLLPLFKRKLMNHTIQSTKTLQLNA